MKKLTLRIELCNSNPIIWREVMVPSEVTLEDLHYLIQDVMGWEDCHEHMFRKGKTIYMNEDAIEEMGFTGSNYIDEYSVNIEEIFTRKNSTLSYEYDFGDSWLHEITLINQESCSNTFIPHCTSGAGDCPPEDCGGIIGYQYYQEVLKNPKHKEYKETKQYYKKVEHFDLKSINDNLKEFFLNDEFEMDHYNDMIKSCIEKFSTLLNYMEDSETTIDFIVKIIKNLPLESQEKIRKILNDEAKAETKLIPIHFKDTNKHN